MRWDYFGVVGEKNNLFYRLTPTVVGRIRRSAHQEGRASCITLTTTTLPRASPSPTTSPAKERASFVADGVCSTMPSRKISSSGTFRTIAPSAPGRLTWELDQLPSALPGLAGGTLGTGPVFAGSNPLGDYFGVDPNIRTPYVQNFNLNFQEQITSKAVLQIGYVGTKGTKLFRFRDINQPSQAQITAFDSSSAPGGQCFGHTFPNCPIGGFDGPDGVNFNVPRTAFPNFFYVNQEESTAGSIYHALQTSLRISSWHGLSSQANFTWSHSIDDASDLEDFIPNAAQPNNSLVTSLERGNSNFDIRRRFSWNFSYQLPKFKGGYSKLTNGWGFDGVVNMQDGQPFSFNYNFEGDYSGSGEGFDRPDVVGPIQYGKAPFNFINLTSFQVPCTFGNTTANSSSGDSNCLAGTRHFGNLGRNALVGPTFKELNFSVFKDTAITERVNLQLRAEFFNLLNHPNFSNPELPNFISDPAVNGLDANGRGTGSYALTATGDVGIGNPFLGGGGPRGVQFAAKFTF